VERDDFRVTVNFAQVACGMIRIPGIAAEAKDQRRASPSLLAPGKADTGKAFAIFKRQRNPLRARGQRRDPAGHAGWEEHGGLAEIDGSQDGQIEE
jgi:hypothetical protein